MMKIDFSRPSTYLTILALSSLTVYDCKLVQAAQPADTIQVEAYYVSALLTSISSLVQSPYADPGALNNPLGVEQPAASPRGEAMRSVVSQSPSHAVTPSLDASAKEPAPKIAPRQTGDFTLSPKLTTSLEQLDKHIAPVKTSFAMIGR